MVDYSKISIKSLNCDPCSKNTTSGNCSGDCIWVPDNVSGGGSCMNKCTARTTKGECEQYHEWNRDRLTPVIYDFDGSDNNCHWHPNAHSLDNTPYSKEGKCRAKGEYNVITTTTTNGVTTNTVTPQNSYCFETCTTPGPQCTGGGQCRTFIEGNYCVPSNKNDLGEIYCGDLYSGHHLGCNNHPPDNTCTSDLNCQIYQDPRVLDFPSSTADEDKGICVSDGTETYDLSTGESQGLMMTDEQCGANTGSRECMNYTGQGCVWEPFNAYCDSKINITTDDTFFNSCKPIMGHVPSNYNVNMIEEEHKNVSEYRDRDNIKFPYITSKYLCDVCHIRDQDLDTMKDLSTSGASDPTAIDKLKYFMIKKFVDFGDTLPANSRSTSVSVTPQQYCESDLDDTHDQFKACEWTPDTSVAKGGKCQSICSKHSPVDTTTTTTMDLKVHKDQCVSDKWYPTSGGNIEFPKLISGNETSEDYFDDRYCTWDGFECHNSIPCKFAQQTRCEDLGYEWYEGSALDVMNQSGQNMGIPLDLSSSYPIVRKGDGKPVEGDMEGVCIYPNVEAGFISQPADYNINPEFVGNQVIMLKWREYGTGWWEDLSLSRKKTDAFLNANINAYVKGAESNKSYFLGENVALIPFTIGPGDNCNDIKTSINNALQNYQYFVYNGEWVIYAEDLIHSIDRSYPSTVSIDDTQTATSLIHKYRKYYGYLYYSSNKDSIDGDDASLLNGCGGNNARKRLNAIYDLRGSINILPVIAGHCALQISSFSISSDTGEMNLEVKTSNSSINPTRFQFVEFIGTEIFKESNTATLDSKLALTVLSKYKYYYTSHNAYNGNQTATLLPDNIVQGYGTLYEPMENEDIEKPPNGSASGTLPANLLDKLKNQKTMTSSEVQAMYNQINSLKDAILHEDQNWSWTTVSGASLPSPLTYFLNLWDTIMPNIPSLITSDPQNARRLMHVVISEFKAIIDYLNELDMNDTTHNHSPTLDQLTVQLNYMYDQDPDLYYDIRKTTPSGSSSTKTVNNLKEIINMFRESKGGYFSYSNEELDTWALYNEYKNFNVFSQPLLKYKDEIYKACCIQKNLNIQAADGNIGGSTRSGGLKRLCSGSLESWKILNEDRTESGGISSASPINPTPKYQTLYLREINGLLKLMSRYYDDPPTSAFNSAYFGGGTLANYRLNIQPKLGTSTNQDIRKAVVWSITRKTPAFWGNLFFNRGELGGSHHIFYTGGAHFNKLVNTDGTPIHTATGNPHDGFNTFNYDINENTLIRPFCEANQSATGQNILWKNILQYTGGNKRELQLSRNVHNINYSSYVENAQGITDESSRDYYNASGGSGQAPAGNPGEKHHIPITYSSLLDKVKQALPLLSLSKREYIFRSLNDITKLTYSFTPTTITDTPNFPTLNNTLGKNISEYYTKTLPAPAHISVADTTWLGDPPTFIRQHDSTLYDVGQITNANYGGVEVALTARLGITGDGQGGTDSRSKCSSMWTGNNGWDCSSASEDFYGFSHSSTAWNNALNEHWFSSDRSVPLSGKAWLYNNSTCNSANWVDTWAGRITGCATSGGSDDYEDCCRTVATPTLSITPTLPNETIFPLRNYTDSGNLDKNSFNMENDFNPTITTNAVADMYRLTHLTPPTQVKTAPTLSSNTYTLGTVYPDSTNGILKAWGANNQGEDDSALWTALNSETTANSTIINMLIYKDDDTSDYQPIAGQSRSLSDDGLRKWCMSTTDSLTNNSNNLEVKSGSNFQKDTHINPDNPENQMGILYDSWLNADDSSPRTNGATKTDTAMEFFSRNKPINAYKYPQLCEPWLLKVKNSSSNTLDISDLAYYSKDIIDWNGYGLNNFDPTTLGQTGAEVIMHPGESDTGISLKDYSKFTDTSLNNTANTPPTQPKWTVEYNGNSVSSITDKGTPSKTFGDLTSAVNTPTPINSFLNPTTNSRTDSHINNITKANIIGNDFYNMLHPLSITTARPREKVIYIDITPNNDMFYGTSSNISYGINVYYFADTMVTTGLSSATETISTSLTPSDASSSIINRYDATGTQLPYFWLHPGIGGTSADKTAWANSPKRGSNAVIVGKNANHPVTLSLNPSETSIATKANFRVAYFAAINNLLFANTSKLERVNYSLSDKTPKMYQFKNNTMIVQADRNTNMLPRRSSGQYAHDIFYKSPGSTPTTHNQLILDDTYYNTHLPPKNFNTVGINNTLFGSGFMSNNSNTLPTITDVLYSIDAVPSVGSNITDRYTAASGSNPGGVNMYDYLGTSAGNTPTLPASLRYFNINMVFPEPNTTEEISRINTCKELIRNKLSSCSNYTRWTGSGTNKQKCGNCFEYDNPTLINTCSSYSAYVMGTVTSMGGNDLNSMDSGDTSTIASQAGVCGILNYNKEREYPWNYIDVTHIPTTFGSHLPPVSPYDIQNRTCNDLHGIKYIALQHAGSSDANTNNGTVDHVAFFKPARSGSSDVFEDNHSNTLSDTAFGCVRKDLSLMEADKFNLSCNTNLSTPVERDKHVIINFIIQHDTTGSLNATHRTKLAIMSEEELLNKALDLGISLDAINQYTKPKLMTKVRDSEIANICEDGLTHCTSDTDCPGTFKCGLYEEWNDLQKYYYNISSSVDKNDFTTNKEWEYVGCGLDLNYNDNSSGELVCKDKYPGLCEQNAQKCNSANTAVREAIMLDCPETCQVQYKDLDTFKGQQIGELSICTSRGRCKWSHDQDPANLLPLCEENTVRELGTVQKCHNYNSLTDGPQAGSCDLRNHPETLNSTVCKRQRCESMQGCKFTAPSEPICRLTSSVDTSITSETDCQEGRWVGASSTGGQCIMPERNLTVQNTPTMTADTFVSDCNTLGGTIIEGTQESCEYHPDLPYSGEDPCAHVVDLDELTTDEQAQYLYTPSTTIHVDSILPEILDGDTATHPHYIKIILDTRLNASNMVNYANMSNMGLKNSEFYPRDKYIYIDNNSDHIESVCSQYLVGKSKIIQIKNIGGAGDAGNTEKTEIIIGGPNKAYILPRNPDGVIDIGNTPTYKACQFRGIYDLDQYYTNNPNDATSQGTQSTLTGNQLRAQTCLNNPKGACNFEHATGNCHSCSLYKDEEACFGGNNPNEYSRCGWGSIENMCGVIGDMAECKKMHLDGCEWDPAEQKCSLNKLTNTNGSPLIEKVGCVKCDDIKHRNTCNSMKNCFWDRVTNTDGDNIGECRSCSSIGDPNGNGVSVPSAPWNSDQTTYDNKAGACDDYELTEGQCEFRKAENHVTGFDVFSLDYILQEEKDMWTIIKNSFMGLVGDRPRMKSDCENEDPNAPCKCSPTRLYPFFPDFVMHNLFFLFVMAPFIVYFMYAWWKTICTPYIFKNELTKGRCFVVKTSTGVIAPRPPPLPEFATIKGGGLLDELGKVKEQVTADDIGKRYLDNDNKFGVIDDILKPGLGSIADAPGKLKDKMVNFKKKISDASSIGEYLKVFTPDMPSFESIKDMLGEEQGYYNGKGQFNQTEIKFFWNGTGPLSQDGGFLGGAGITGKPVNVDAKKALRGLTGNTTGQAGAKTEKLTKAVGNLPGLSMLSSFGKKFSVLEGWKLNTFKNDGPIDILTNLFVNLRPHTDSLFEKRCDKGVTHKVNFKGIWAAPVRDWRNLQGMEKLSIIPYALTLFMRPQFLIKLLFLVISAPFTILQLLANCIRLAPSLRLSSLLWRLGKYLVVDYSATNSIPYVGAVIRVIVLILGIIICMASAGVWLGGPFVLLGVGFKILMRILEYGLLPNHNYVDPIEGEPIIEDGEILKPVAAKYPQRLYREEWDDMIRDPISEAVVQQREQLLPDAIRGDINDEDNISDAYRLAYMTITPDSLNWTKYIREAGKMYNKFINRVGDKFIYTWIVLPFVTYNYIKLVNNLVQKYYETNSGFFDIKNFVIYTLVFAIIIGVLHALMTPVEAEDTEFDGVQTKCYGDIETPFTLGTDKIHYPKICFGESTKEDKPECPYGCYYIGTGTGDPNYGKVCKDNRSVLTLGGFLDPEPTLNIPLPSGGSVSTTNDWTVGGKAGEEYKCPPTSRFLSKQPYDSLCATTAKRCKATKETRYNTSGSDDYCEMLYRKNNYDDSKCNSNFSASGDKYPVGTEGPKGVIDEIEAGINCELITPYEGYKDDVNCPFPLPAAQNDFFSEQGDTRAPISLWQWTYDKIQHPERMETCTALCQSPGNCTNQEQNSIDICQAVKMDSSDNKSKCENTPAGVLPCQYFPENIPLQMSIQNQERYLIVNQDYGTNLFS